MFCIGYSLIIFTLSGKGYFRLVPYPEKMHAIIQRRPRSSGYKCVTFQQQKTTFVIIILSTCVFLGLLYKEYSNLNNYMNYISENGRSALFHEEYINQNLAFRLSRAFSADANIKKHDTRACQKLEHLNGVNGFNLASHDFQALPGTLQTTNASCEQWVKDIAYLPLINSLPARKTSKYTFSNYSGYAFDNIRYYIDVANSYIYINKLVDSTQYTFNNWLVIHHNSIDIKKSAQTISIDDSSLKDLAMGENIISHVYRDGYTHHNIISMLTPVFKDSTFKGIIITDINISDLATSFYTADRPVIWKFLSMHIEDNATGKKSISTTLPGECVRLFIIKKRSRNITRCISAWTSSTLSSRMPGLSSVIS
ncbi:hypothetical protein OFY05_07500 [Pseudocitrobacter faecalis]|nr:hypothetical protein OFY05_07500 [Pseudocitrobacter faecalis]